MSSSLPFFPLKHQLGKEEKDVSILFLFSPIEEIEAPLFSYA